jgi:hypothetical protein
MWKEMFKTIFKAILVAVSYYTLKKVIEKLPAPIRPYATFALRAALFFILFLTVFAFLSGRVNAIDQNAEVVPKLIINVLLGVSFVITILISFLFTAFVEELYRKISGFHQKMKGGIKATAEASGRMVQQSVETTKSLFSKAMQALKAAIGALYETSTKVTSSSVDKAGEVAKELTMATFQKMAAALKKKNDN